MVKIKRKIKRRIVVVAVIAAGVLVGYWGAFIVEAPGALCAFAAGGAINLVADLGGLWVYGKIRRYE
jgi:hypothetical protein